MSNEPSTSRSVPADLSQQLLAAVKRGESTTELLERIADLRETELDALTGDRQSATAFWVNCYNAFAQLRLENAPETYEKRRRFFGTRAFTVAGTKRSLDDIEHGILRRSKWKYGLGYIPAPFPDSFERRYRLDEVDPRIHFALNCGAASCPAILAYTAEHIDEELDRASASYLEQTVEYDDRAARARVPRLFLWFRGDFGGRRGIRSFLREYGVVPEGTTLRVRYQPYDWSKHVGRWHDSHS